MTSSQIMSYNLDASEKWCIISGISSPDSGTTIVGNTVLYSIEAKQHQTIEGNF